MNRAIIFAHFDRDGLIDPHVRFYLSSLKEHASHIIFISTSALDVELESIRGDLVDVAITRENIGYDFLSWKIGYGLLARKDKYDEILFVNDSVYGPIYDLSIVFSKSVKESYQFWGLVKSHEIAPHIQSYFFCFSRALVARGVVDAFWERVSTIDDKAELIREYEVGMTDFIKKYVSEKNIGYIFDQRKLGLLARARAGVINGLWRKKNRYQVVKSAIRGRVRNPCHQYWRSVLESGVPFIKVELLRDNPEGVNLVLVRRFLSRTSSYPVALIEHHLRRVSGVTSMRIRGGKHDW